MPAHTEACRILPRHFPVHDGPSSPVMCATAGIGLPCPPSDGNLEAALVRRAETLPLLDGCGLPSSSPPGIVAWSWLRQAAPSAHGVWLVLRRGASPGEFPTPISYLSDHGGALLPHIPPWRRGH